MKQRRITGIGLMGLAAAMVLGGCTAEDISLPIMQTIHAEPAPEGGDLSRENPFGASGTGTSSPEGSPGTQAGEAASTEATQDTLPPLDILTVIQLEAGREALLVSDLFDPYEGQEAVIQTVLSPEELSAAGSSYQINVVYLGRQVTVTLEIVDTTPPLIEGVKELYVNAGESLSYKKGILLSDNASGEVLLEIDNSQVNLDRPGVYPLHYIATDASGNQSTAETTVTVNEAGAPTEEDANQLADALIAKLIPAEMSKYDAAYTLWNWCRTNIRYAASAENYSSLWSGAYEGLHKKSGDCYTYYATYSLLLTRCGIENLCVARLGGTSEHWWNLVNVGEGWYHCDSSPRRRGDPYLCFMQTDAQVQAYTESYPEIPNYYTFDPALYPDRETAVIFGDDPAAATAPEP